MTKKSPLEYTKTLLSAKAQLRPPPHISEALDILAEEARRIGTMMKERSIRQNHKSLFYAAAMTCFEVSLCARDVQTLYNKNQPIKHALETIQYALATVAESLEKDRGYFWEAWNRACKGLPLHLRQRQEAAQDLRRLEMISNNICTRLKQSSPPLLKRQR